MFWFRESLNGRMLQKNSFVLQHINGHPIGLTSNIHPLNESHETKNHMKPKIPQWQQLQHCNIHSSRSWQNICNSVFGTLTQIFGKLDHVFDNQVPATIWRFWKRKTLPGDTPFHPTGCGLSFTTNTTSAGMFAGVSSPSLGKVILVPSFQPFFTSTVEILDAKTKDKLCFLDKVEPNATIGEIKSMFHKSHPQWYPARQSIRLDPKGKSLKDEDVLQHLPVGTTATFYFRDLGAQISWVTVFLTEYAGPLLIYLMFYFRVPFIYAPKYDFTTSKHWVVHLACMCHSFHYVKRLLETLFVHRFSHGTMPLRNIFKNCTYYWGFAAWMAYYINHPLYTPPIYGEQQIRLALIVFLFCQIGNFSIHIALRNLRPPGSKTRKIPYPTKNPFTWIFLLVSCPNYTYELGSWLGFTLMTQCLPVAAFTLVGFIQMTVWAKGKHRSYLKEFRDYPTLRSPILPFIL
uniref:Very-long-chain enoyl-CoA reductase n=1 Tax=Cyprinus carpio carpio TaxID=630221 RepID=A0A9J7WW39_CYPCA